MDILHHLITSITLITQILAPPLPPDPRYCRPDGQPSAGARHPARLCTTRSAAGIERLAHAARAALERVAAPAAPRSAGIRIAASHAIASSDRDAGANSLGRH